MRDLLHMRQQVNGKEIRTVQRLHLCHIFQGCHYWGDRFFKSIQYTQKSTEVPAESYSPSSFSVLTSPDSKTSTLKTQPPGSGERCHEVFSGLGHSLPNIQNREIPIFGCGYRSHVSNAGGTFGDSLCWNPSSLRPVHAGGLDAY